MMRKRKRLCPVTVWFGPQFTAMVLVHPFRCTGVQRLLLWPHIRKAETFTDLYVCSLFYSSLLPPTVQRHVKLSGSELVIGVTRVLPLKQTSDPPPLAPQQLK